MANFQVELPDGRKFKVEGVANPEAAYAAIEQMMAQQGGQQQTQPQQDNRSFPRAIADVGASFAGAVPKAAGAMVSIGSQVPVLNKVADPIAQSLMNAGEFVDDALLSDYQKNMNADMANAVAKSAVQLGPDATISDHIENMKSQGGAAAKFIMENPSQALMLTSQALPYLVGGGIIGRGVVKLAPSTAGATAGAIGEGSIAAGAVTGDIIAQLEAEGIEGYTPDRLAALPAGVLTAVIGRMGAKVNQKLGGADVDTAIAGGGTGAATRGLSPKGAAIGGTTELGEEFLQSAQEQAFTNIGTGDPISDEVGSSAVQGAAAGFGMGSVIGSNVMNAGSRDLTEEQMEQRAVAADVARNIRKVADNNGYSLDDVNPTSGNGARQALEEVRNQQVRDVVNLAKKLKKQLDPRQAETLEQLLMDYSAAEAAIAAGKRKVSTKVTTDQYDAVKRLVTPYKEGNALLQTLLGTNVVTDLFKDGMKGGLSQWTDLFNPLLTSGHSYDPTRVGNVVLGGLPLMTYGIDSVIPQAAIVLGGQAIDKVLGGKGGTRRKLVKRFVNLNEGNDGLGSPTGPSLIAQAQQAERQEEQEAEAARIRKQQNTDAFNQMDGIEFNKSPLGILYLGTGLNQAGLEALLAHIEQHYSDKPAVSRWTDETRRNLAGEENQIEDINKWVGALNGVLNTDARLDALREDQPDNPLAQRARRRAGFGPSASQSSAGTAQQQTQGRSPAEQSGIDANNALADRLLNGMESDQSIPETQKDLLRTALLEFGAANSGGNIGANGQPLQNALDIVERLRASGVMPRYINDYIMPYVQRVAQQEAGRSGRQQPPSTGTDLAFDEDFGPAPKQGPAKPVFKQTASLSVPMPVVDGQIKATKNTHGFMPHLRVKAPKARDGKPLFTIKTNNKNASAQINAIDEVLSRYPDPAESVTSWTNMMGDALATRDIPAPPRQFINDINNGGAQTLLSKLTAGQIADADHGFANAREFRQAYIDGTISVNDTGRLFLWSFLSKGVSPYTQESLFIDSFDGIDKWIGAAADGTLKDQMPAFYAWAETTAPRGSGQSGAGAMHNLNGFGRDFLLKMSRDAGLGDGRSRLQVIHDMMADPKSTGKEIRRQFMRMGEGVGVDNKVVSFTLLVAGFDDVVVMDRVQMRQMWNDGRFDGLNLYDGFKDKGKTVTGSQLSTLTNGARGLLIYEALEQSLLSRLPQIYQDIGRPEVASLGRYHWETWVASSEQEASHATIDAILARAKGDPNPLDGVMAKEGEYGAFAYGARYGIIDGKKGFIYNVPNAGDFKFTVPEFTSFLEAVRSAKSGVIPSKFRVSQSGNAPWYFRDEVNLKALAEKAKEHGKQVRRTDEELRQDQAVSDGRALDAVNGGTNSLDAGQSFDQEPAGILRSEQANDRGRGRSRRDAGGQLTPLEDAPVLRGHKGPIQNLVKVVEKYAAENNIPYVAQGEFVNVDPAFGARVAEAYDQMKDQPNDPAVKAAYADMIRQTKAQYDALVQDGYTFFFIDPASGYGDSPVTALEDLRLNKRMGIFPTDEGYGSDENATFDDNPLLEKSGETWANEDGSPKDVLYNDLFRAVHDAFGHGLEGSGFRARGEENAFQAHIRLFVGPARGAMTSETRGQNSYLNYGPHGENNQTASVEDTKFADQKIGVMPSWTWSENIAPDEMIEQSFDQDIADQSAGALTQQPQQQSPFNMKSLVNKMFGSQPATPDQVKAQLPVVRPVFEIGKKGTKYADGIQDIDSAVEFAKAINITLKLFNSQQEMFDNLGVDVKDRVRGVYRKRVRTAYGLREGAQVSDELGEVTSLDSLTTAIHELSHGLAFDSGFESLFDQFGGISTAKRRQIDNEIDNIQKYADLYIEKNPSQRRKVRRVMEALEARQNFDDADTQARTGRYLDYVKSPEERAVDPILLYLLNPKVAKNIAPATSALVKEMMNKSTDKFQLYTYPFATMVAVVLAMMLNGRAEEEEEEQMRQQQMPAGALSPQAGALSPQQAA